jgi:hypothetical protein
VVEKAVSTQVALAEMVVQAVVVELAQVQVAQQQPLALSFSANPVVHQMEQAAGAAAVLVKQDQLAVLEKVVTESRLQSLALLPFMAAVAVAVAQECVDSAETAAVAQDRSVVHINFHKEQMHSKQLQEQQIPAEVEEAHLMVAQVVEALAEVEL